MKILNSNKKAIITSNKYCFSGQLYSRDFKSFPLISVQTPSTFSFANSNNPVIQLYELNSSNWYRTSNSLDLVLSEDENKITLLDGTLSSTTRATYTVSFDGSAALQSYDCGNPYFKTNNFIYSVSTNVGSSGDYVLPRVGGLNIYKLNSNKTSVTQLLGIKSPYVSSKNLTNNCSPVLVDSNESRDIIIVDMNMGCGYSSCGTYFSSNKFSGIDYSSFGLTSTSKGVNDISILKFNPADNTASSFTKTVVSGSMWDKTVGTAEGSAYRLYTFPSNSIKNENGTFTCYVLRKLSSSDQLGLWKLEINEETNECSISKVEGDLSAVFFEKILVSEKTDYEKISRVYNLIQTRLEDGKKLITVITSCAVDSNKIGLTTYLVDELNNTLEYKGSCVPQNPGLMQHYMINDTLMLTACISGYDLFSLNKMTGTWQRTGGKSVPNLSNITYDNISNSLFYIDNSNHLYMDRLDLAISSMWYWKDENISWEGTPISTSIDMMLMDAKGDIISQNVTLYIQGNAIFSKNEQKEITVATLKNQVTNIPVTITGDGVVTVSAKASVSVK